MKKLRMLGNMVPQIGPIDWPEIDKTDKDLVNAALMSKCWAYEGKYELLFNGLFNEYNQTKHGFLVANGTVSLEIALKACNVGPGDEVIVPAATWVATAYAVLAVGARPIFADIDIDTLTLAPDSVVQLISKNTKAIIPVHLYGNMANMDELCKIAKKYNLYVIEDCAHAHGSEWKNKKAGGIGDIGSFSFHSSKLITSGEGGFVSTNQLDLARKLYGLKNCGRKMDNQSNYMLGGNYRISELQSALLVGQLEKHKKYDLIRFKNRKYLDKLLSEISGISVMPLQKEVTNNSQYRYIFKYNCEEFSGLSLKAFINVLESEGIVTHSMYTPVYRHELYPIGNVNVELSTGLLNTERAIKDTVLLDHTMLLQTEIVESIYEVIKAIKHYSDSLRKLLKNYDTC